jgi:uncharacterized protein YjcR
VSNIKEAEKDYIAGLKYKEIAEKYGVSLNTVKSWKTRYSWTKKVCTQKQKGVHTKRGAPKGSKNALGNRGGHAPPGNHNAVTHGLFAKIIPEDDIDLLTESGKLQGLEYELQVARYKVNRLIREQEQQQMHGTMASSDGPLSYSLKDDFYEQSIQRGLDLVRKIEAQLQKERIDKEKLEIEREKLSILQAKVKADDPLSGGSDTEIEVMLTDGED